MHLPPLSHRLLACCRLIHPGDRVADIGCDHGYLGIYLLLNNIAGQVIAADLREGPLSSAVANAEKYGVREKISFYLSDGVKSIPRDFDTMVCAGMGGDTIRLILEAAPWLKNPSYRLILQCQSHRPELRKYLYEQGFSITREILAKDSHFIYPVMEVRYAPADPLTPGQYHITPALIKEADPLLPEFFQMVITGIRSTTEGLSRSGGEKFIHYQTVLAQLEEMEERIYGNHR